MPFANQTRLALLLLGTFAGFGPVAAQSVAPLALTVTPLPGDKAYKCSLSIRPNSADRPYPAKDSPRPLLTLQTLRIKVDPDSGKVQGGGVMELRQVDGPPLGPTPPKLDPVAYEVQSTRKDKWIILQFTQRAADKARIEAGFTNGTMHTDGSVTGTVTLDYSYSTLKDKADFHWQETIDVVFKP